MKLLDRILVATDFGVVSDAAVEMAVYVARQFDSQLDFVHVTSPGRSQESPGEWGESSEKQANEDLPQLSARLEELAQKAMGAGVRSVETVLAEGDPFERIGAYAESRDVNVIFVGAGEVSPSGQVFLGNTAARLRRWAATPVWIVKPNNPPPIRRILCPVDMLSASSRALRNAIHIARKLDAELTVLTVAQSPLGKAGHLAELRSTLEQGPPERREPHHQVFDEFLSKFDFHLVRSEKVVRLGNPRHEVVNVAQEIAADLIVMGSAGRTGLAHILVGGVARRVAQVLPCSVITVRSESPIRMTSEDEVPRADATFCATHPSREQCDRFQHGDELLREGLANEAIDHYRACLAEYGMCANAWLQLSKAHARIGELKEAQHCAARAQEALRRQEHKLIDDEAQGSHILYRRMFGV
ncbi:MAG: hypothetical protein CMJ58_23655 [Planctomycetaceae bacterium]|nr:hypothetical protein [Planctomycetaceae bacterium]